MRNSLDGDPPVPGRALLEDGELVAGSMSRAVAALLFDPASSRLQLDERVAGCLQDAAGGAADLTVLPERARAGAAVAFAVELSVTLADRGRPVRTDGFFCRSGLLRSDAERLAEAVLLAARDTVEERRVRHLGYLVAEVFVSADIDAALAGRALRLAGAVSWRQLSLLAAVGRRDRSPLPLTPLVDEPHSWNAWGAAEELTELRLAGLLDPAPGPPRAGGAAQPRLRPADLRLTRRGVLLHRLLALDFVRDEDAAAALAALRDPES